jgi:GT2 family glycosyltransferase
LSIVIVSFNTKEHLKRCLQHVFQNESSLYIEIIVVDNNSVDGSVDMLVEEFPQVCLIRSSANLGFAGANNRAFKEAQGRFVVLLNSDAFLQPNALKLGYDHMVSNPTVGLAGGRLVGEQETWQPANRSFPSLLSEIFTLSGLSYKYPRSRLFGKPDRTYADPLVPAEADWVPGAFSIIASDVLKKAGFFDETFFLYFEEVDLCKRIKSLGYRVMYWPDIVVVHLGGESSKQVQGAVMSRWGSQLTLWRMRSELLYYRKHHGFLSTVLIYGVESLWHGMRCLRNLLSRAPKAKAKAEESWEIIALKTRAWRETRGGLVSPARPW